MLQTLCSQAAGPRHHPVVILNIFGLDFLEVQTLVLTWSLMILTMCCNCAEMCCNCAVIVLKYTGAANVLYLYSICAAIVL